MVKLGLRSERMPRPERLMHQRQHTAALSDVATTLAARRL